MRKCKTCGKRFKPKHKDQIVCKEACLVTYWESLPIKTRTRRNARAYATTLGYKSISEVRYAGTLSGYKVDAEYESEVFTYQVAKQKYTPDFKITRVGSTDLGEPVYLEYKGKFTGKDRKKLKYVKKCNPTKDIRLVFERSSNRINKSSKSTYGDWATKNGFTWYDANNTEALIKDLIGED